MRTLLYGFLTVFLMLPHLSHSEDHQIPTSQAAILTSLCELAEHPQQFDGKLVSVRGRVMGSDFWIEDFDDAHCSAWVKVMVVYPDTVKPQPGFGFEQDDSSALFYREVKAGRNVEATFIGRFDVAYVWQNHTRVDVGKEHGYGLKDQYGARIVLQRIANVIGRPIYRK